MAMVPSGQNGLVGYEDPAAIAAAESVKAEIQSAYVMAFKKPRNEDQARFKILAACARPSFAEKTEYHLQFGQTSVQGPTIRFAELALREWGNIRIQSNMVYDDDLVRRVKVTVLDLETNSSFGKEVTIPKTVERSSGGKREVVSQRTNSRGETTYIVKATEQEIQSKEAIAISKVVRNEGLRLLPTDLIEEALVKARATLLADIKKDPDATRKKLLAAFLSLGVQPKDIEKFLGHSTSIITPEEMQKLTAMGSSIRDGQARWADYVADTDAEKAESKAEELKDRLKKRPGPKPFSESLEAFKVEFRGAFGLDSSYGDMLAFAIQNVGELASLDDLKKADFPVLMAALDKYASPDPAPAPGSETDAAAVG
jgi:hypothetical protein